MSWTTPATWTANQQVDEDDLNAQVRDNLTYLGANYPYRSPLLFHGDSTVITGNTIALTVSTVSAFNVYWAQSTAADGDTFTQSCILAAGTYTLYVLGRVTNANGILDWYVDDVLVGSGQDWYGGASPNNIKTVASIVIATHKRITLKGVVNGKNASSSGYNIMLQAMWLKQAAD